MSGHRVFRYLALGVGALLCLACGDSAYPTSPSSAKPNIQNSPTAPVSAAYSRYILISGVWVCVDCSEASK
jgi:hypothetical protein